MKERCLNHRWIYVYQRRWYRMWTRHVYRRCPNCQAKRHA